MIRIFILVLCYIVNIIGGEALESYIENVTMSRESCPQFRVIENGIVKIRNNDVQQIAVISCEDGYDLDGPSVVYCIQGGWGHLYTRIECTKRCFAPPYVKNGSLEINGEKDDEGMFKKGTLATYSCGLGFVLEPKESQYRVCEKGIWTGPTATCKWNMEITGCPRPKDLENGYFVLEKTGMFIFNVGQRLHYGCKSGYVLSGTAVQQCLEDGNWSPKIPPVCTPRIAGKLLHITL